MNLRVMVIAAALVSILFMCVAASLKSATLLHTLATNAWLLSGLVAAFAAPKAFTPH